MWMQNNIYFLYIAEDEVDYVNTLDATALQFQLLHDSDR
jgi:hypothetical protein